MQAWEVLIVIGGVSGFIFLGVQAWLDRHGREIAQQIESIYVGFAFCIALAFLIGIVVQEVV